jgi:pilus assembly protein CpaC
MKRRLIATMMCASCAILPFAAAPIAPAHAQAIIRPASEIVISIGRGELISVPGTMADVFIANDSIADVQVKSNRQLYIFGRSGGETTLYVSNAAGNVIWSANVRVGSNLDSVDQMLTLAMPEAKISVATMGSNTVLLTGTVAAPEDAAEAERLVTAFVGNGANVISRLKMATPLQVNLQVRIAEVSRSLVRTLGASITSVDDSGGFMFGIGSGRGPFSQVVPSFIDPVTGARIPMGPVAVGTNYEGEGFNIVEQITPGTTLAGFGRFLGMDIGSALDLAERDGLVTTLSQPNLTALSGETAEFLAGGEFPIPLSQGLGSTSIEYKKFGVSLAYTPTVLSNGRISIRVRPEVSELSSQGAVTLNGFTIPGLTVRRAETTVELGSGQAFMIAGLLSNNANNTVDKAPGLGDLPVLGNLFKSTEFRKGQTELVIIVTPYLVNPVNDSDIKLPTDGFRAPTALQQLIGMENDGISGGDRPKPRYADEGVADPQVSMDAKDEEDAVLNAGADGEATEKRADAAAPGFSL